MFNTPSSPHVTFSRYSCHSRNSLNSKMKFSSCQFLLALALGAGVHAVEKPNIIMILSDDFG